MEVAASMEQARAVVVDWEEEEAEGVMDVEGAGASWAGGGSCALAHERSKL